MSMEITSDGGDVLGRRRFFQVVAAER